MQLFIPNQTLWPIMDKHGELLSMYTSKHQIYMSHSLQGGRKGGKNLC